MESFAMLRRRTSELLQNVQQNLPSLPQMPSAQLSGQTGPKGTWERLAIPHMPRSSHSLNVVSGAAYIFGGEVNPREPVDNCMHVVTLPFSGGGSDYYKIPPLAAKREAEKPAPSEQDAMSAEAEVRGLDEVPLNTQAKSKGKGKEPATEETLVLGDVPAPRVGHATATIGTRIFMFGGRGGPEMKPLEESGRVWVFDTRSRAWSALDPAPAVKGGAIVPHPAPRSYHCATSTDKPRDFPQPRPKKSETWQEWAVGDISKTGTPQNPIVGHVAEGAVDQEDAGYGTFFVHGGCLANGDRTSDIWAFDARSKTWTELPAAPGPARGGTAICISKSRLFRFGGYDGKDEIGEQLDFLHLEVEMFDDNTFKGEVAVHARGGWQTILQNNADASSTEISAGPHQEWPEARSVTSFEALDLGGGREYLVLAMGERQPSSEGHAGAGKFCNDVWMFQVPPLGMSAASLTDAMLQAIGRKTGEGRWTKVATAPYDDENDDELPEPRGWMASAPMGDLDESGIVMLGGLGEDNERLGDGWILRLG